MLPSIPKKTKDTPQFPFTFENITFDSKEEVYFYWWLKDLEANGIIKGIKKGSSIQLEEPLISCGYELLPAIKYTPDFLFEVIEDSEYFQDIYNITTSPKARKKKVLIYQLDKLTGKKICIVEVKADFDNRDKTREVNIKRKWVHSKLDIYVELVKIPKLFGMTFLPERYLRTDMDTQPRKINYDYKLLKDTLEQ